MAETTMQYALLGAGDDFVASFQIEDTSVRGRIARLGDGVLDSILKRHDYPRWAAYLLGEAVTRQRPPIPQDLGKAVPPL